ncbi:hypothetical protein PO909_033728 [Leuciscus waleckii]
MVISGRKLGLRDAITVILSFCVSCNCTDEETHLSGDQAGRLRHMWLLSMRDAKRREKVQEKKKPFENMYCNGSLETRIDKRCLFWIFLAERGTSLGTFVLFLSN